MMGGNKKIPKEVRVSVQQREVFTKNTEEK